MLSIIELQFLAPTVALIDFALDTLFAMPNLVDSDSGLRDYFVD